ncbi:MAG: sugar phosphate isomerase/epimerase family protein [Acidimicrobiia bacterium]
MKEIELHVHSFGLRFRLRHHPGFDVFRFLEVAAGLGFTGVNISANGPGYRDLGGTSPEHFASVRAKLEELGLRAEVDTSGTDPDHLGELLGVAKAVGADQLRTYTRHLGTRDVIIERTAADLLKVIPAVEETGINVLLENHEDLRGSAIAEILSRIDHGRIRALFDYGNSEMVGEDPWAALEAMAPYTRAVHLKDHVLVRHKGTIRVQGVVLGSGRLPVLAMTDRLYQTGLRRFCFENVWGYTAAIQVDEGDLPTTAPFELDDGNSFLDAGGLGPSEAVEWEWVAFEQSWEWLQNTLTEAGYRWGSAS